MDRIHAILARLEDSYPSIGTALRHANPFQLLVATILSAQSTDVLVNRVTPELFRQFPSPESLARAPIEEIEARIASVNFFRNKARHLKETAAEIVSRYHGHVPETMEELVTLPGVARKTANVVLSQAFGKNVGVVVDTHVARISRRLGLTKETNPVKIERDLMKAIPGNHWKAFTSRIILHGRSVCKAARPLCNACVLETLCPSAHRVEKKPARS